MNPTLEALYEALDFQNGALLPAIDEPSSDIDLVDWLDKGEWLAAAKRAGADRVFFVKNNPIVVFAECGPDDLDKIRAFNHAWCLGRPRLLFLVSPGEISVLDLAQKPISLPVDPNGGAKEQSRLGTLARLGDVTQIAEQLKDFHRDHIESGKIFGDERFGDGTNRADKTLIQDLKIVRGELIKAGLSGGKVKFAHSLIGRSIFIRYLEDRGILTQDYFRKIALHNSHWEEILNTQPHKIEYETSAGEVYYPRILEDKAFTYALFRALARDFNGDMFPAINDEEDNVSEVHLRLIQDLLYGDAGVQKHLFFHTYRFDIVPLELISSIYEEFYDPTITSSTKKSKARQDGAYYTPPSLAELTISRILTLDELQKRPRILDPACGSGIFLVEAFRRIARFEWHTNQNRLSFDTLKQVLREQIVGIEVNEEAARITAFSLYLALLHYLDPPAISEQIHQGNRLPNLLVSNTNSENHYHSIWVGNAFDTASLEADSSLAKRFADNCADIIVSNPPWGDRGNKSDPEAKDRQKIMHKWCKDNNRPIGNKEPAQAFLWRFLDFLKRDGKAAVLVPNSILVNNGSRTKMFREQWMAHVLLMEVFDFSHVRKFFFRSAIAPFALLCFSKNEQGDVPVVHWSAKQVVSSKKTQAIMVSKYDRNILRDEDLGSGELWKTFIYGRLMDWEFIKSLQNKHSLGDYVDRDKSGRGYQLSTRIYEADRLQEYRALRKLNSRYEPPILENPPERVYRLGIVDCYEGLRIVVNEGISEQSQLSKGMIVAQLFSEPFCFSRSTYGIKLLEPVEWRYKVLLGILWSSLAKYYLLLTSANWGRWHYKLLLDELYHLPVVFDEYNSATKKVISAVDKLRNYHPQTYDLLNQDSANISDVEAQRAMWEKDLDQAIFELYGLDEEQIDLVYDFDKVTLPFFYKPFASVGVCKALEHDNLSWLKEYILCFARRWNPYLDGIEIRAEIHVGAHGNMIAVEFFPADKTDPWELEPKTDSWGDMLERIGTVLSQPMGTSQLLIDGVAHVVSDDGIIVIKRNEKRYWTRSLAREDAEITLYQRMAGSVAEEKGES